MKYLSFSIIMALGFVLASVFAQASDKKEGTMRKKTTDKQVQSGMNNTIASLVSDNTVKMKIKGLVCAFCAQGVEKLFNARKEVSSIKVSLEDMLVTLVLKAEMNIADEELKQLIKDAGFNVESIDRSSRQDSTQSSTTSEQGKK